eukprot:GHVL01016432.1.p1 GENE.GHVL01016432.1~~GHVL01016432.1.p1  ORF type:complete len:831 (-),score=166.18 GHVL01016432.1:2013-4505(-)
MVLIDPIAIEILKNRFGQMISRLTKKHVWINESPKLIEYMKSEKNRKSLGFGYWCLKDKTKKKEQMMVYIKQRRKYWSNSKTKRKRSYSQPLIVFDYRNKNKPLKNNEGRYYQSSSSCSESITDEKINNECLVEYWNTADYSFEEEDINRCHSCVSPNSPGVMSNDSDTINDGRLIENIVKQTRCSHSDNITGNININLTLDINDIGSIISCAILSKAHEEKMNKLWEEWNALYKGYPKQQPVSLCPLSRVTKVKNSKSEFIIKTTSETSSRSNSLPPKRFKTENNRVRSMSSEKALHNDNLQWSCLLTSPTWIDEHNLKKNNFESLRLDVMSKCFGIGWKWNKEDLKVMESILTSGSTSSLTPVVVYIKQCINCGTCVTGKSHMSVRPPSLSTSMQSRKPNNWPVLSPFNASPSYSPKVYPTSTSQADVLKSEKKKEINLQSLVVCLGKNDISQCTCSCQSNITVEIHHAREFHALRHYVCGDDANFVRSMTCTKECSQEGGKSGVLFYVSHDRRYLIKVLQSKEQKFFNQNGASYFSYLSKAFFHQQLSTLVMFLGMFTITGMPASAAKKKVSCMIFQNLRFGLESAQNLLIFDLKGAGRQRYVKDYRRKTQNIKKLKINDQNAGDTSVEASKKNELFEEISTSFIGIESDGYTMIHPKPGEKNSHVIDEPTESIYSQPFLLSAMNKIERCNQTQIDEVPLPPVLWDQNFRELTGGVPLLLSPMDLQKMHQCLENDSSFLAQLQVVDYSLFAAINTDTGAVRLGMIDFFRAYTWDKQLETMAKSVAMGVTAPGETPTVLSPAIYKHRFQSEIRSFFMAITPYLSIENI